MFESLWDLCAYCVVLACPVLLSPGNWIIGLYIRGAIWNRRPSIYTGTQCYNACANLYNGTKKLGTRRSCQICVCVFPYIGNLDKSCTYELSWTKHIFVVCPRMVWNRILIMTCLMLELAYVVYMFEEDYTGSQCNKSTLDTRRQEKKRNSTKKQHWATTLELLYVLVLVRSVFVLSCVGLSYPSVSRQLDNRVLYQRCRMK